MPAAPPPSGGRIESLDILRGLMALAVAVYHFTIWYPVFQPARFFATTAAKVGHYGVEGFFIISGFCFFHLYWDNPPRGAGLWRFHLKRFLRIAPLFYLAAALNLALGLAVGPQPSARMLAENATLTFGLFHPNHALVLGGWSIGIEYVFYLAFPVLAWAAGRWRPFLALAALATLAASLRYSLELVPAATMAGDAKFHTYVQVANHAFLFFLGRPGGPGPAPGGGPAPPLGVPAPGGRAGPGVQPLRAALLRPLRGDGGAAPAMCSPPCAWAWWRCSPSGTFRTPPGSGPGCSWAG